MSSVGGRSMTLRDFIFPYPYVKKIITRQEETNKPLSKLEGMDMIADL